jgi:hypothetical protein
MTPPIYLHYLIPAMASRRLKIGRDEAGTNNKDTITSDVCVDDDEWHHVAGVFDNAETLTAKVFVDGELIADGPDEETIGPLNTEEGANVDLPVMIGGNAQDGAHWRSFTGLMDEVAVYDRAFTDEEVMAHYLCGIDPDDNCGGAGGVAGDFNGNGMRDLEDVDLLAMATATVGADAKFDLTGDGNVDGADLNEWVTVLTNTFPGDSNFDGEFSSSDFVTVFTSAKYETGQPAKWSEGDWNGDGVFSSADFVTAFTAGAYEKGPNPGGLQVVPEPSSIVLALFGFLGLAGASRRRN